MSVREIMRGKPSFTNIFEYWTFSEVFTPRGSLVLYVPTTYDQPNKNFLIYNVNLHMRRTPQDRAQEHGNAQWALELNYVPF